MVGLLDKMGNAIESMEGDIRQMNDFLKAISFTQVSEASGMECAAEMSSLGLISEDAYSKLTEQNDYYADQANIMEQYDQMHLDEVEATELE